MVSVFKLWVVREEHYSRLRTGEACEMTFQMTSKRFVHAIGSANEWIAGVMRFFLLGLVALICIQVVARYIFNHPFIWSNEVNIYMFGIIVMFAGAYTYKRNCHISVDILERLLTKRSMAIVRLFLYPLAFLFLGVLIWEGSGMAYKGVISAERFSSVWAPLAWPLQLAIPLGCLLFFLQVICKLIDDIYIILEGKKETSGDNRRLPDCL